MDNFSLKGNFQIFPMEKLEILENIENNSNDFFFSG